MLSDNQKVMLIAVCVGMFLTAVLSLKYEPISEPAVVFKTGVEIKEISVEKVEPILSSKLLNIDYEAISKETRVTLYEPLLAIFKVILDDSKKDTSRRSDLYSQIGDRYELNTLGTVVNSSKDNINLVFLLDIHILLEEDIVRFNIIPPNSSGEIDLVYDKKVLASIIYDMNGDNNELLLDTSNEYQITSLEQFEEMGLSKVVDALAIEFNKKYYKELPTNKKSLDYIKSKLN